MAFLVIVLCFLTVLDYVEFSQAVNPAFNETVLHHAVSVPCKGSDVFHERFAELLIEPIVSANTNFVCCTSWPALMILNDCFTISDQSFNVFVNHLKAKHDVSVPSKRGSCFIFLLLLLSGNVQPNPGPPTCCEIPTPDDIKSRSGLVFMHLNVCSLLPKLDFVRIWVESTGADVAIISETWLGKSVPNSEISLDGYNVYRADRPKKKDRGGIAIYVKNTFHVTTLISKSIPSQLEFLALNLEISKRQQLTVVGCYRPPVQKASKEALSSLTKLLSKRNYNELLVLGDLNWDWLTSASDDLKELCLSLNLTQIVNSATRPNKKNPGNSSLIDLILTNAPHKYPAVGVFANDVSDHCTVATIRDTKISKGKPRVISKRDFKHFSEQGFFHDLFSFDWGKIDLFDDVENAWSYFYQGFKEIVDRHAPMRKFRVKGRDNPWFTTELSDLLHERNKSWAKARKSGSDVDWLHFRQLRNRFVSYVKSAKSKYYLSVTTENLSNPRKFWKAIKSLSTSEISNELPPCLTTTSGIISDKVKMLNCFNEHFVSCGKLFDSVQNSTSVSAVSASVHCTDKPIDTPFMFSPFNVGAVHDALCKLNTKKSAGPDNLEPFFLKTAADFIAAPLTSLFNLTLSSNSIPKLWKSAYVLPLLKGGEPTALNNYRPISKLPVLAKILEGLVSDQLRVFLSDHDILSNFQSGFRKEHSTITATMKVVNDIIGFLDKKQSCAALFIDLSKAFDTVDHHILRLRLSSIGLSDQAVGWFENYLSERSQCVQFNGITSEPLNIANGVPQGSVLAPLLFSIYINNIGQNVSGANLHFYADDTVVYCAAPSITEAANQLQAVFNIIQNQLSDLKLLLNAGKTKVMLFSLAKLQTPLEIVTAQGENLEQVSKYKYLGIWLDDSLLFKPHVDNLLKKLRPKLGFFFRHKSCFSFETKKRLISATFLSVLDYGDILYMNAPDEYTNKLDAAYHSALRFITNCKALTHRCVLYNRVGWPSLSQRRLGHWYMFIYKALIGKLPSYICSLISQKDIGRYELRSQDVIQLNSPCARIEFGKKAFRCAAPSAWTTLQDDLKLNEMVSLPSFKARMTAVVYDLSCSACR